MKLVRSLVFLCSLAAPIQAQSTWYIDAAATPPGNGSASTPYSSIQFAIDQSTTVSGDTLLVAPGTYAESLRFFGKSIVLKGVGGAAATVLQGSTLPHAAIRWIDGEGAGTRLEGFTVQGAVNDVSAGGGLHCVGAVAQVRDCVFANCGAYNGPGGGARVESGSNLEFERVLFGGCFSWHSGGGLDINNSQVRAFDCWVQGCSAGVGFGGGAGGGFNGQAAVLEVHGSQFLNNSSDGSGAGIFLIQSVAQISDSVFRSNLCDGAGAGVRLLDCTAAISQCLMANNGGASGGGFGLFSNQRQTTQVRSTTFVRNYNAGAGVNSAAVVGATLDRCTLASNVASFFADSAAARDCSLTNCIVWGNLPSASALTNCTVRYSNVEGGASGVGNLAIDPLFIDLAGDDLRLLPGSPCINSGDPASFPDPDGSRADMGAFPWIPEIEAYCTGKLNSAGCVPTIAWFGRPSFTTNDFHVIAINALNNKSGLCFWGLAQLSTPFVGGTLCVAPPTVRTPLQSSGGSPLGNNCSGSWAFSFSAPYMLAAGIAPDTLVYAQFWGRDPGFAPPNAAMLSNAVRFRVER